MGDGHHEDPRDFEHDELATDPGAAWQPLGASQGPRQPAEGVRIIGAEEAAAAIESGDATPRTPDDAPRFGDVPEPPRGPRPSFRFPGVDPASVPKPPVVLPEPEAVHRPMGHLGGGFNEELVSGPVDSEGDDPYLGAPDPEAADEEAAGPSGSRSDSFSRGFWGSKEREGLFDGPGDQRGAAFGSRSGSEAQSGRPQPTFAAGSHLGSWPSSGPPDLAADAGEEPPRRLGSRWWEEPVPASARAGGGGAGAVGADPGVGGGGRSFFDSPSPAPSASDRNFWGDVPAAGEEYSGSAPPGGGAVPGPGEPEGPSFPSGDEPAYLTTGQRGRDDSGSTPLPHWTEPPSGENPRVLPDGDPGNEAEEVNAWSSLSSGPRWRDQPNDWDDSDFHEAIALDDDDETRVGALRAAAPAASDEDMFSFEEAPVAAARAPRLPRPARARRAPAGAEMGPAPYDVGGGGSGGRSAASGDVPTRVITGLIAAGVALVAAVVGPGALVLLVTVAVTMAAAEMFQALRSRGYQPATLLGLVATASLMGGVYWRGETAFPLILALYTVFCLLWYLVGVVTARPTVNIAVSLLTFLYVGFLGSFAALLLKVPLDNGIGMLLGAVIATAAYDIGAFFVGRSMGRTPLAPSISPNKTFEGVVGATLVTVLVSIVVVGAIHPWDKGKAFWLALVVSVAAPLGDLCESMIKRDLGVKDMGAILPGHGGVLDRIDALLFVVPATWYLWHLF